MSGSVVFDTHKFVKQLTKAKMPKEQAEALADNYVSLLNDRIATKDDLRHLEDRLKTEIGHLESRLATKDDFALLKTEIGHLESRLATKDDFALLKTDIGNLETKFTSLEDRVATMIMRSQIVTIGIIIAAVAVLLQITN